MIREIISKDGWEEENENRLVCVALVSALFPSHRIVICPSVCSFDRDPRMMKIPSRPPASHRNESLLSGGPGIIPPPSSTHDSDSSPKLHAIAPRRFRGSCDPSLTANAFFSWIAVRSLSRWLVPTILVHAHSESGHDASMS